MKKAFAETCGVEWGCDAESGSSGGLQNGPVRLGMSPKVLDLSGCPRTACVAGAVSVLANLFAFGAGSWQKTKEGPLQGDQETCYSHSMRREKSANLLRGELAQLCVAMTKISKCESELNGSCCSRFECARRA